jgi:hypothetical protein
MSSSDLPLATSALAAAGFALLAPVLGRIGHPAAADLALAAAALCGFGSFALAGLATYRAHRRAREAPRRPGGSS